MTARRRTAAVRRARPLMGTLVAVTARGRDPERLEKVVRAMFREMERLEAVLSEWRPDSAIAAVNDAAGRAPVVVPPEVIEVAQVAVAVAGATGGAFDPTWGALADLWRFRDAPPRLPDPGQVAERLRLVDYRDIEVDARAGTLCLRRPGMRLGLGGIAKAYVAERAAGVAAGEGVPDVLVDAGGDVVARGRNGDRPWTVAVRDPGRPGTALATVELHDESVATSGDYESCFMLEGRRYHHLLDPGTGRPAAGVRSVTVIARHAARADALATGLFVLGADRGAEVASTLGDVAALFVREDGTVRVARATRPGQC